MPHTHYFYPNWQSEKDLCVCRRLPRMCKRETMLNIPTKLAKGVDKGHPKWSIWFWSVLFYHQTSHFPTITAWTVKSTWIFLTITKIYVIIFSSVNHQGKLCANMFQENMLIMILNPTTTTSPNCKCQVFPSILMIPGVIFVKIDKNYYKNI